MRSRYLIAGTCLAYLAATGGALAAGELNIYNWGNYTNPDLITKFEAEHDIKVTITDYDSNDTALAKVKAGGQLIYKDRIYGEVSRPLRPRYGYNKGYHYNSGKAGKALKAFSIFVDIASDGKINHNYGRPGYGYGYRPDIYRIEKQLRREAVAEVARYVGHIRIPRKYGRY